MVASQKKINIYYLSYIQITYSHKRLNNTISWNLQTKYSIWILKIDGKYSSWLAIRWLNFLAS